MSSRLDRVLTYGAGLAVLSATVATLFAHRATHIPTDYQVGEAFAKVAGLEPSRSPGTLVWFINTHCAHCRETAGVLRQSTQTPRSYQVVIVGYEDVPSLRRYVDMLAIGADVVLQAPLNSIRFSGVPKLAMLDRSGVIKSIWSGSEQINASLHDIQASARAVEKAETMGGVRR